MIREKRLREVASVNVWGWLVLGFVCVCVCVCGFVRSALM